MIPVYILGILLRYGPQHGYMIKKIITEQLADFSKIKLPTIYYHLEEMQKKGLLKASKEKLTSRPEKIVYSITEKGIEEFNIKLRNTLSFDYRPTFNSDSSFFFSEFLKEKELLDSLNSYISKLEKIISYIELHQKEIINHVPKEARKPTKIIFNHHLIHFRAEEKWAKDAIEILKTEELNER